MSQPLRVTVACLQLAVAALGLAIVAGQIASTYVLPPGDSGPATERVDVFEPAVAGTVVGSLAVLALLTHLVLVVRRRSARWMWITAGVLSLVAIGMPIYVTSLDRPTF